MTPVAQSHSPAAVRKLILVLLCALATGGGSEAADEPGPAVDPKLYQAMEYRLVGPYRGGRVTAVSGVVGEAHTFYMGSTGGGVWKTTDGGETWHNVSDKFFKSASVGAINVAPSDPNVVYAGMGSACIRGNISPGDGLYRSTDAGKTWTHVGLADAGQIGAIAVHPQRTDTVYVAALGHAFGPNEQRGVFRSHDGGHSWEKVLFVSDRAGAVDLAMAPDNPRILFAAIWQAERQPWGLSSGGERSGLYRSVDSGDTWQELTEGLPSGIKGRIGVAVSAARPGRLWALVEAEDGGLYRSDDGGDTFRLVNDDRDFLQRAWYYTHVYADPRDAETVYVLNVAMWRSNDGGEIFDLIRAPHGDHHALWINPDDPRVMINGNDGGANVSVNGGRTWSTQANQPTAEFYRVAVDNGFPYRVYGAQQDNSTVSIPSRTTSGGIGRQDWYAVGGCESGHVAVDPRDRDIVYAGCYGGSITRYDHSTGQTREIVTYPEVALGRAARDLRYRFQWNAPIRLSPHDPDVLYHASQFVHRSRDAGQTWEVISPDLTRDDPEKQGLSGGPLTRDNTGVEVYGTVFAFEPSPGQPGLLWAGSDDGRVHVSRDDGGTWKDVTPRRMPQWGQVNAIELSAHGAGRAFLSVTRYRQDDFRPYVFRTDDFGESWVLLTDGGNGIPADHFVRVVREDPERKGLLYAGTEFGLYVSFDDGRRWQPLQLNLPVTPITDLAVKDGDLVVATQGRSFWILDDLSPLRQLHERIDAGRPFLFQPRAAYRLGGGFSFGGEESAGQNPPAGAVIHYLLPAETGDEIELEILNEAGEVLRSFSSEKDEPRAPNPWAAFLPPEALPKSRLDEKDGMNRFVWDLRLPDARLIEGTVLWGLARGPVVPPGRYAVRLNRGDWTETRTFEVLPDPRLPATPEEYRDQFDLAREAWRGLSETHDAVRRLRDVRDQVDGLARRLSESGRGEGVGEAAAALRGRLAGIEELLIQSRAQAAQDVLNYPPALDGQWLGLLGVIESADDRPTAGAAERCGELRGELDRLLDELQAAFDTELAAFNDRVRTKEAPPVIVP